MEKNYLNYREESKKAWGINCSDNSLTMEQLILGSILRIADAVEKMSAKYTQMEADLKWYKEKYLELGRNINSKNRSIAAYQGHINRLKKEAGKTK